MVLVDGKSRYACTLPVADVADASVSTVEGLEYDAAGAALIKAFETTGAGQCGYCLSGILVSAARLLRSVPRPQRHEIAAALDGHLCRCGAHSEILDAVERAAMACSGEDP